MEKFRFFKKNLQTKGPSIAKAAELKPLLEKPDTNSKLTWAVFKEGLEAATKSTHATDKILAMMKSYSMISTKKLAKEDDKKTTHIKFPLGSQDKTKIETIPSSYGWKSADTTTITNFITSYDKIGKLAKAKISWVITKMHNPKELAQLAFKTEKRDAVNNCLKLINDEPIKEGASLVTAEFSGDTTHPRIYTLNEPYFEDVLNHYRISISQDFRKALKDYTGPKSDAFKDGLTPYDNEKIKEYNTKLQELMDQGTIDGRYPEQTDEEKADQANKEFEQKNRANYDKARATVQTALAKEQSNANDQARDSFYNKLNHISTAMNALLDPSNETNTNIDKEALNLNNNGLSPYPQTGNADSTLKTTKIFLAQMLTLLQRPDYDACIKLLTPDDLQADWRLCFTTYIKDRQKAQQKPSEQWTIFCSEINYMSTSQSKLDKKVNDCLTHPAFGGLKDAFKSLGTAFSKTGAARTAQINAAKEQIPDDIEDIHKQDIEKIFDKLMESSSAPKREDNSAPKPAPAATSSDTTKAEGSNGFAGAQPGNFFTINTPKK